MVFILRCVPISTFHAVLCVQHKSKSRAFDCQPVILRSGCVTQPDLQGSASQQDERAQVFPLPPGHGGLLLLRLLPLQAAPKGRPQEETRPRHFDGGRDGEGGTQAAGRCPGGRGAAADVWKLPPLWALPQVGHGTLLGAALALDGRADLSRLLVVFREQVRGRCRGGHSFPLVEN